MAERDRNGRPQRERHDHRLFLRADHGWRKQLADRWCGHVRSRRYVGLGSGHVAQQFDHGVQSAHLGRHLVSRPAVQWRRYRSHQDAIGYEEESGVATATYITINNSVFSGNANGHALAGTWPTASTINNITFTNNYVDWTGAAYFEWGISYPTVQPTNYVVTGNVIGPKLQLVNYNSQLVYGGYGEAQFEVSGSGNKFRNNTALAGTYQVDGSGSGNSQTVPAGYFLWPDGSLNATDWTGLIRSHSQSMAPTQNESETTLYTYTHYLMNGPRFVLLSTISILSLVAGFSFPVSTYAALTLDGTPNTNTATGASTITVPLTTSLTNDIIVVDVHNEVTTSNGASVTVQGVTAPGLTFAKRSSVSDEGTTEYNDLERWWALATSTFSGTITVTFNATIDDASDCCVRRQSRQYKPARGMRMALSQTLMLRVQVA